MITLYGIKNCDTVKKAQQWLNERQIDYQFHDFRNDGVEHGRVEHWLKDLGAALVNKRSTTWKQLDDDAKAQALSSDTALAAALLVAHPTLIKRPVLVDDRQVLSGFSDATYAAHFTSSTSLG